jgi:hypothetical protein
MLPFFFVIITNRGELASHYPLQSSPMFVYISNQDLDFSRNIVKTFLCTSQATIWISHAICQDMFVYISNHDLDFSWNMSRHFCVYLKPWPGFLMQYVKTTLCTSQTRTWISHPICQDIFVYISNHDLDFSCNMSRHFCVYLKPGPGFLKQYVKTFLCISQTMTWISHAICQDIFVYISIQELDFSRNMSRHFVYISNHDLDFSCNMLRHLCVHLKPGPGFLTQYVKTCLCISQTMTWISHAICQDIFVLKDIR